MKSEMRDADMPLLERIERAIDRITSGSAPMRVPVEATDPDIVLCDAANRLARLEEALGPFAALAKPLHERMDDRRPIFAIEGSEITVFDLLRARAALGEKGGGR